jgi:hypothetical protein
MPAADCRVCFFAELERNCGISRIARWAAVFGEIGLFAALVDEELADRFAESSSQVEKIPVCWVCGRNCKPRGARGRWLSPEAVATSSSTSYDAGLTFWRRLFREPNSPSGLELERNGLIRQPEPEVDEAVPSSTKFTDDACLAAKAVVAAGSNSVPTISPMLNGFAKENVRMVRAIQN